MTDIAALAIAACIAIGPAFDRITVGDLAAQVAGLESVAPDQPVSFAPAPGVRRIFTIAELRRIGARWNAPVTPERDLCFERLVTPLDPAKILEAMRKQLPQGSIEILEATHAAAPEGALEFPLAGLRSTPAGGFWTGSVLYAGNRRFAVWARVKVQVTIARVVATGDLKAGQPIAASDLRIESHEEFPTAGVFAETVEQVAGKLPRRPVSAGTAIRSIWLEVSKDVSRGDTVKVEVYSGAAVLEFEGTAETPGVAGQTISIMNPASKKRFQAKILGRGKVVVGKAP